MHANTLRNPSCGCVFSLLAILACRIGRGRRPPLTLTAALVLASVMGAITARPGPTWAAEIDPATLAFNDAMDLAVAAQPLLDAQRSAVSGSRETAVAAGQLPDPMLVGGLADLPVTGADRFSLRRDSFTQYMLGVKQVFPGGDKRELRGARASAEAERLDTELQQQIRMVRRQTGLAWLNAWNAAQAQDLVRDSIVEAEAQSKVVEINYRAGRASQADLSAARVVVGLLEDLLASLKQQESQARNQLRRWIGDDADRPISTALPEWPEPDLASLLQHLEYHPQIAAQARAVEVANAELKLAREEYKPDWSLQAGYGYRPEFSDMVSVQFETALPFFTRNRQDRTVQARAAEVRRAELLREDVLREQRAAVHLGVTDWRRLRNRLEYLDRVIVPQAQQRFDAALVAYATGSGLLLDVLDARRSLIDVRIQHLALEADSARNQVELQYFSDVAPEETQL